MGHYTTTITTPSYPPPSPSTPPQPSHTTTSTTITTIAITTITSISSSTTTTSSGTPQLPPSPHYSFLPTNVAVTVVMGGPSPEKPWHDSASFGFLWQTARVCSCGNNSRSCSVQGREKRKKKKEEKKEKKLLPVNEPGFDQSLWQQVNQPGEATVNTPGRLWQDIVASP